MNIEVLLSTMFFEREADDFLEKMNIQSDIVIGNQCDRNEDAQFEFRGNQVKVLSRRDRGVGKNRNTGLFHATADIVIFADNDVCYYDGYKKIVEDYYHDHEDADVVIFNFKVKRGDEEPHDINKKNKKAKKNDITKFGAWAVTARRESLLKERISFSLLFGGGAKYGCGEDTLFLMDCYNRGLNIYLCDRTIGYVAHKESTWFQGITEKYISDKGALFQAANPVFCEAAIVYHVIKHRNIYAQYGSISDVLRVMFRGAEKYKHEVPNRADSKENG